MDATLKTFSMAHLFWPESMMAASHTAIASLALPYLWDGEKRSSVSLHIDPSPGTDLATFDPCMGRGYVGGRDSKNAGTTG